MNVAGRHIDITTAEIVCDNGMPGFLAYPTGGEEFPTVILMHERYGLVKHTKDQAMRCARDGFAVLAPNFFFKHPDQRVLNAGNSRYDMSDPESVELIQAAIATLKQHKAADLDRIVVAGYCQTGRHPLVFAAEVPISAAVVWYGAASAREWAVNKLQPKPLDELIAALPCPVFAAFGEADHIISLDDVRRFRNCLEAHNKSYDIHIYRDAPHGWLTDTMPGRYRKAQADAGWAAQQRFLAEVFAGGAPGVDEALEGSLFALQVVEKYRPLPMPPGEQIAQVMERRSIYVVRTSNDSMLEGRQFTGYVAAGPGVPIPIALNGPFKLYRLAKGGAAPPAASPKPARRRPARRS